MKKTILLAIVITSSITAYPALTKAMMLGTGDFTGGGGTSVFLTEVEFTLTRGDFCSGPLFRISWYIGPEHVGDTIFVSTETDADFEIAAYVLSNGVYDCIWFEAGGGGQMGTDCSFFAKSPGVVSEYCDFHGCNITAISLTVNALTLDHPTDSWTNYTFDVTLTVWGDPPIPKPAMIYYVDADANGVNDGSSWVNAYNYLQDALITALSGDEIWVAQGIYTPDRGAGMMPGDREATFQLKNGVTIKGGYAGLGERDPNDRDIELYETILSGDLNGNDIEVANPRDLENEPTRAENSYHVVTGSGTDTMAILEGFNITAGNANGDFYSEHANGGGMYNSHGNLTLVNCTFSGNSGRRRGGGMYNFESSPTVLDCMFSGNSAGSGGSMYNTFSSPTLTYCTFSGNSAGRGGSMYNFESNPLLTNCTFSGNSSGDGGGMYNSYSSPTVTYCTFSGNIEGGMVNWCSSPTLTNCTFSGNSAGCGGGMLNYCGRPTLTNCTFSGNWASRDGGGMYNWNSNPTLTGCTFSGNSARNMGGVMYNDNSSPTLTNCTFSGNSAGGFGGGMGNFASSPVLINCTFSGNSADRGGGICSYVGSSPILTNCIIWGNEAQEGPQIAVAEVWSGSNPSRITVSYSDAQGGKHDVYVGPGCVLIWDEGNIDADPCFTDPGCWDPNGTPDDANDDFWVEGDYHLKSEGWRWDTKFNPPRWGYDYATSRCIDAGNPGSVLGEELLSVPDDPNNTWGQNLRINMGAYGGTAEASMPPYDWAILADLTNDGTVNFEDFAGQTRDLQESESEQPGDLDRNGVIDFGDLALLVEDWLEQTSWHEP